MTCTYTEKREKERQGMIPNYTKNSISISDDDSKKSR